LRYAQYYSDQNLHVTGALQRRLAVPGLAITGQMAVEDDVLRKTEYYSDFLRPQKIFHLLGGLVSQEDTHT
jgi:hypothetical protein